MAKITVGLIGYGYWGPNIARVINEISNLELKYCVDLSDKSLRSVRATYPNIITSKDYKEILKDKDLKAVFIVTPAATHFKIAKDVIKSGKHVFIEKPITTNSRDAQKLIDLAEENKVKLAVGHIFLFNPAVKFIKDYLEKDKIGKLKHFHFQRRNLGPAIRNDVNVVWDLAPHDISMLLYLVGDKIDSILATGQSFFTNGLEDVVSASIKFKNGIIANMIYSWIDPVKIRDITIVGDKKMVLFDDVSKDKIKIFDKNAKLIEDTVGVSFSQYRIALHSGKVSVPRIKYSEPLKEEISNFINAIRYNQDIVNSGENGKAVVEVIESIQKSLALDSKVIKYK